MHHRPSTSDNNRREMRLCFWSLLFWFTRKPVEQKNLQERGECFEDGPILFQMSPNWFLGI